MAIIYLWNQTFISGASMIGSNKKFRQKVGFFLVLLICSSLLGCAGHNTEKRLENLESRAADQDILELRVDKVERELAELSTDMRIVKAYHLPEGARWVEPESSHNLKTENQSDFISPQNALEASYEPISRSEPKPINPKTEGQIAQTFTSMPASPDLILEDDGLATMSLEQSPGISGSVSTAHISFPQLDEKKEPSLTPAYENRPSLKPATNSNFKALPSKYVTGNTSYDRALDLYFQHRYKEATIAFNEFAEANSQAKLAPNALYWQGESYYAQKDYPSAIISFKNVVGRYSKDRKAADALLKIGMSYQKIKDSENARFYWEILIDDFPKSASANKAKNMLRSL